MDAISGWIYGKRLLRDYHNLCFQGYHRIHRALW